jgi:hypothetical protein
MRLAFDEKKNMVVGLEGLVGKENKVWFCNLA